MQDRSARYTLLEKLGTGSFGTVWKALSKDTGKIVAIKQIDLESSNDDLAEIQLEITLLAACDSKYITGYYESFITGFRLWIVMEYMTGGSALDLMQKQPFSEVQAAVICREVLEGLAYLHSQGKLHRDIKAANILLSSAGSVKLADFGVAAQLSSNMSRRHTFVGTPFWMAPEVIKQAGYNHKADIWSLGITAMELLLGEPPLSDFHPMRVIFLIPKSPAPVLEGKFSSECKDFVKQCLQKEPRLRPSAKELLKHPFIRRAGSVDVLSSIEGIDTDGKVLSTTCETTQETTQSHASAAAHRDEDDWEFETIKASPAKKKTLKLPLDVTSDDYATIKPRPRPGSANRKPLDSQYDSRTSSRPSPAIPHPHTNGNTANDNASAIDRQTEGDLIDVVRRSVATLESRKAKCLQDGSLLALITAATAAVPKEKSSISELLFIRWAEELLSRRHAD